jgi:hypothetical protein
VRPRSLSLFLIFKMRSSTHFTIGFSLLGLTAALPDNVPLYTRADLSKPSETYDYVIVGGGVTGLIVANRLSEDKKSK